MPPDDPHAPPPGRQASLADLAASEAHKPTEGLDPAMVAALNKAARDEQTNIVKEVRGSRLTLGLAFGVATLGVALIAVLLFFPDDTSKSTKAQSKLAALDKAMVVLKAGKFTIGCGDKANDCFPDESPAREIDVASFALMKVEVTAADYARCVGAKKCKAADEAKGCSPEGTDGPVNCVGWKDAGAYCAWKGWRLPTEVEWEAAARGAEATDYPWGAEGPECGRTWKKGCSGGRPPPVGTKAGDKTWAGILDMGGSVSEWTADDYAAYPGGETYGDSAGKSHRGGAWTHSTGQFPTAHGRAASSAGTRRNDLGFRCAKSL